MLAVHHCTVLSTYYIHSEVMSLEVNETVKIGYLEYCLKPFKMAYL